MSKKEELQALRVADLVVICKANGIPHYRGKSRFKKDELIEAILGAGTVENDGGSASVKGECEADNRNGVGVVGVEGKAREDSTDTELGIDIEQKMAYVENAEVGTLVAFRLSSGKVKSAKVIKRSAKNRMLKVETSYGATYVVPYEDVVWVRTGKRWPRGVYNLLKGTVAYGEDKTNR